MTTEKGGDVVLITGGCGFLGQHIVRLIEERDPTVKEIRIVDLRPYENRLRHTENKKLVSIVGDICDPSSIEHAFDGVNCVFHCAAYINFQYPPNLDELDRVNVNGTRNIIDLCIKHNVPNLIYTSTVLVSYIPYMGSGTFSVIVNQTENKAKPAGCDSQFLIPGFPASKLRAEKLVLSSYGRRLSSGEDHLKTVSLRPTWMYGEEDERFFPTIMRFADKWNGTIPCMAEGGKKQLSYVGNVAWAHLCAKEKLNADPKRISGLPIYITDDTPVTDTGRIILRISSDMETLKIKTTSWSIPILFYILIAMLYEMFINFVNVFMKYQVKYCPRGMLAYAASFVLFDRLRASIALEYEPIYTVAEGMMRSAKWYEKWYVKYKDELKNKKL